MSPTAHIRRATIAGSNKQEARKMARNEGTIDRALRVILGLVLIGLTLTGKVGVWGWVGVVPLVTGLIGSCPLYSIFGISTCKLR